MVKWSIIIPVLNEEKYLPKLLDSIKRQDFKDYEVIVVDSDSKDNTIKLAKEYGCRILKGKRGNPGTNRNIGAKAARGKNIIFFDADVILPERFLRENTKYFEKRKLDVAGCYAFPISKNPYDWSARSSLNAALFVMQYIRPCVEGFCMFARKKVHSNIMFDEKITFAEDSEYFNRAYRKGCKTGFLKWPIWVSMRRFDKEGRINLSLKYIQLGFKLLKKEIREKVDYDFGNF